jgi:hypothetical protein
MANPIIGYYDHLTGEQVTREMNAQELKEWEDSKKPSIPKPLPIHESTEIPTP